MKTLTKKLKSFTKDKPYLYFTSEEFTALVKMRRVKHINATLDVPKFCDTEGSTYYPSNSTIIKISKRDALEVAKDFVRFNEVKGEENFIRCYVSTWNMYDKETNALYIHIG